MKALVNGFGPIGKSSSFVVKISDEHGNIHKRTVPLKLKSVYQAELAAIKYVFQAIPYKDIDLKIKTASSQIPQIFNKTTKGEWIKRRKPNALIDEVRELSEQFKSFECAHVNTEETLEINEAIAEKE